MGPPSGALRECQPGSPRVPYRRMSSTRGQRDPLQLTEYSGDVAGVVPAVVDVPVSRARSHPVPGVVAGSGTMQISNIMDVISIFIHITHECMDSKKLIMWSHTESDV